MDAVHGAATGSMVTGAHGVQLVELRLVPEKQRTAVLLVGVVVVSR